MKLSILATAFLLTTTRANFSPKPETHKRDNAPLKTSSIHRQSSPKDGIPAVTSPAPRQSSPKKDTPTVASSALCQSSSIFSEKKLGLKGGAKGGKTALKSLTLKEPESADEAYQLLSRLVGEILDTKALTSYFEGQPLTNARYQNICKTIYRDYYPKVNRVYAERLLSQYVSEKMKSFDSVSNFEEMVKISKNNLSKTDLGHLLDVETWHTQLQAKVEAIVDKSMEILRERVCHARDESKEALAPEQVPRLGNRVKFAESNSEEAPVSKREPQGNLNGKILIPDWDPIFNKLHNSITFPNFGDLKDQSDLLSTIKARVLDATKNSSEPCKAVRPFIEKRMESEALARRLVRCMKSVEDETTLMECVVQGIYKLWSPAVQLEFARNSLPLSIKDVARSEGVSEIVEDRALEIASNTLKEGENFFQNTIGYTKMVEIIQKKLRDISKIAIKSIQSSTTPQVKVCPVKVKSHPNVAI
jgi:hypothetical protein